MPQPVYLGTIQEVLGDGNLMPEGFFAQEVLRTLSPVKEYYLDVDDVIKWRVPDIREAVRAPRGMKIFGADFSQIEVRIMAWLSQDPFLIEAISRGGDIHSFMACEIFGLNYEEFYYAVKHKEHPKHKEYSSIRSNTKTTTFGTPYGAGPKRVAMMTGLSEEAAQEFIEQYFAKAYKLKEWLDELRKDAVKNRYTRSAKGRVRSYDVPPRNDPNYRKVLSQIQRYAGNHPIQATCADLLKVAMAKFYLWLRNGMWNGDKLYPHANLLLAVHDELVGECDEKDAGSTETPGPVPVLLKKAMEDAYNELNTWITTKNDDGEVVRRQIWINQIPNKVDVVVNDFWSKD